jgi:aspartate dehydrogenase
MARRDSGRGRFWYGCDDETEAVMSEQGKEWAAQPEPLRVGLIGLGAIGGAVARLLTDHSAEATIVGALVRDPGRVRAVMPPVPLVATPDALLALRPAIVVEAGGHAALAAHAPAILRSGCDLLAVSVGALADPAIYDALLAAAHAGGGRIIVASGAIGALDALAAAALGGLDRVTHTTRKPAHTLLAADEAAALTGEREIFRGSAREGALRFPESIHVAAAVALAGLGFDRTEVRVIADPAVTRNGHEVVAEGAFGTLRFAIENIPSVENPRTGRLVALSIVRALLGRRAPLVIG